MKKDLKKISIQSNTPFIVSDNSIYVVTKGKVDVFVVKFEKEPVGKRNYFFTAEEGEIIAGSIKGHALL